MSIPHFATLLLFGFSSLSCGSTPRGQETKTSSQSGSSFVIKGTMKFTNVEGGCWYLETEAGERFELAGEDLQRLRVEGLMIEVEGKPLVGVSSTCQVGVPVEVQTILKTQK